MKHLRILALFMAMLIIISIPAIHAWADSSAGNSDGEDPGIIQESQIEEGITESEDDVGKSSNIVYNEEKPEYDGESIKNTSQPTSTPPAESPTPEITVEPTVRPPVHNENKDDDHDGADKANEKQKLVDDTLYYAIDYELTTSDSFVADVSDICDRFGVDGIVVKSKTRESIVDSVRDGNGLARYDVVEHNGDTVDIRKHNKLTFISIEAEEGTTVLWAGLFKGGEKDVPYSVMYYKVDDGEKLAVIEAGKDNEDAKLYIDISEIDISDLKDKYGDNIELGVWVSDGKIGSTYVPAQKVAENAGVYSADMPSDNGSCYVIVSIIHGDDNGVTGDNEAYIWAGLIDDLDKDGGNYITFHQYPEIRFDISEDGEGALNVNYVTESGDVEAHKDIKTEYRQVTAGGTRSAETKSGRVNKNGATVILRPKTHAYVAIMVADNRIFHVQSINVKPRESDSYKIRFTLNEEHINPIKDGDNAYIAISGIVDCDIADLTSSDINVYVNEELCSNVEFIPLDDGGYSFKVVNHPVAVGTTSIDVFMEHANLADVYSSVNTINVGPIALPVEFSGYEHVYDGTPHMFIPDYSHSEITYLFSDSPDGEWSEDIPEGIVDVGEKIVYVKADYNGHVVTVNDNEGNMVNITDGVAALTVKVLPADVKLYIKAVQSVDADGNIAVYNGSEQAVSYSYMVDSVEDASGTFDKNALETSEEWKSTVGSIQICDAGEVQVPFDEKAFAFVDAMYPNYSVNLEWIESTVTVEKLKVNIGCVSQFAVYESGFKGLPSGAMDRTFGESDFADNEYYSNDFVQRGEQRTVGWSPVVFIIDQATQDEVYKNYEFDYEAEVGILAVFPQSIADTDAESGEAVPTKEELPDGTDAEAVAEIMAMDPQMLPGYYCGMQVSLLSDGSVYNGLAHEIGVEFKNTQGKRLQLVYGTDYKVEYYRDGQLTEDLTNAGVLEVSVIGIGNYTGTRKFEYTIMQSNVIDVSINISSWISDGAAAGSDSHPVITATQPDRYVFYDATGNEIAAPVEAGKYGVKAVWNENENTVAAESAVCEFEILPAEAPIPTAAEVELTMDGWVYDGIAAGAPEHMPELLGVEVEIMYTYYDEDSNKIDPPSDAGTYTLRAEWGSDQKTAVEFEIEPAAVTVAAREAEIVYGDPEPELAVDYSDMAAAEAGLVYEISREPGTDAGSYKITVDGEAKQGNYQVTYEPATLVIVPQSVKDAAVIAAEEGVSVAVNGSVLAEGVDYELVIDNELNTVSVTGIGNYCDTTTVDMPEAEEKLEPQDSFIEIIDTDSFVALVDNKLVIMGCVINDMLLKIIACGSAVAALLCGVAWIRLNKKLRKERNKLLDKVSLQSADTIRENMD